VSQREMAEQALPAAVKEYGPPDILVNSAGISHPQEFWNTSYETFDKIIKVNLYGTVNMTGILLPYLKESKGYIVNLSSIAGFIGVFSMTPNNFELDFPAKQTVNGSESSVSVLNGGEFRTVPELLFEKRGLIQLAQQLLFSP
jgi:3-dehydrosphinganine reductase